MTGGSGRNHTIGEPNNRPLPIVPRPSQVQRAERGRSARKALEPKRTRYDATRPAIRFNPIKLSRITLSSSLPIRRELRHMNLTL
ncbi:hypothetical protein GBZ26_00465 [Azospirillum formosense]|uniref:Uncharacterized protein n=1 Tax=Azospirillum formosense TaxID=861533 RepID=A0ABX2KPR1_9PROT|nr:hypothetical protein [Azospirillum formosense]